MPMHALTEIVIVSLTEFIKANGLLAVFILMSLESALVPIPSEVTMPFAGFLAGMGVINIWAAIVIGALGNLTGSLLAYWLGYVKGELWVREAIGKWGKWLLIREEEFDRAKAWYGKYGQGITFASRLLPVFRTFISLPAFLNSLTENQGISRLKPTRKTDKQSFPSHNLYWMLSGNICNNPVNLK